MSSTREGWALRAASWRRRFAGAIGFALLLAVARADAGPTDRHAAMVIDANTGAVLHSVSGDLARYPASLTKMMTLYLAFEQIEQGRLSYATRLKVSQEAASVAPSKLDLDPGEEIRLIDAIKALVTKSANDMAVAIAERIAGNEARFAELMTEKARVLGMRNTTFRNASGLPNSEQVTTARDMLTLAVRLHDDFPRHYPLFALRSFSYNGATYANHNTLLASYQGMEGMKTGYTRMSGFNLVASVRRGNKHVVAAVFGGASASLRNAEMRMLLNRSWSRASEVKTRRPAPALVAHMRPAARPEARVRPQPAEAAPAVVAAAAPAVAAPPVAAPAVVAAPVMTPVRPRPVVKAEPAGPPRPAATPVAATPAVPLPPAAVLPIASVRTTPAVPVVEPVSIPAPVVQVARVRPVMVAPRVRPAPVEAVAPAPAEPAPPPPEVRESRMLSAFATSAAPFASHAAEVSARVGPAAERAAAVVPAVAMAAPIAPAALALPPSAVPPPAPPPMAAATPVPAIRRPAPPAPVAVAARAAPPAVTTGSVALGNAPSTLQAQADALSRGAAPVTPAAPQRIALASASSAPAFRLQGPSAGVHVTTTGYQIQIGAYNSQAEADQALAGTRAIAGNLLDGASAITIPARKDERHFFRARFAGFDARTAASMCLELRRRSVDCFVMKAE